MPRPLKYDDIISYNNQMASLTKMTWVILHVCKMILLIPLLYRFWGWLYNRYVYFSYKIFLIFLDRDLFVAEHMKPVRKIITESNLDFIFNMDDESFIVSINDLKVCFCFEFAFFNFSYFQPLKGRGDNKFKFLFVLLPVETPDTSRSG